MTDKTFDNTKDKLYYVAENPHSWDYRTYDDLESATNKARAKAWANGYPVHVLSTVAIAQPPAEINTVQVNNVT